MVDVESVVATVQQTVFSRRIRIKDSFRDFDPRRTWRCSKMQFIRALDTTGIKITHEQAAAVADFYCDGTGDVHYGHFSDRVDEVFGPKKLEHDPTATVADPGSSLEPAFAGNALEPDKDECVQYVLHRIALLCKARGVYFKYCYEDFDKCRCGCVTELQFRRCFPFIPSFTDYELDCLVDRYTEKGRSTLNGVNYRALHDDVSERRASCSEPPYPRSDLVLRPDESAWEADDYTPEEKIQAKVVERRIRVREPFSDYDPLRKGYVTIGQTRCLLDSMGIKVSQVDFDQLKAKYGREDGMFHYSAFCDVVDEAFAVKGLERTPLLRTAMPDEFTTVPCRRNCQKVPDDLAEEIARVEDDIRARVVQRRIFLKPQFLDFDPCRSRHISKNQFARALGSLGFELTEEEVNLIAMKYCDLGNKFDINYAWFCKNCDPPTAGMGPASSERRCNLKPDASYFTRTYEHGVVSGPGATAGRCHTVVPLSESSRVVEGRGKLDRSHLKVLSAG